MRFEDSFWRDPADTAQVILAANEGQWEWPLLLDLSQFEEEPIIVATTGGPHARGLLGVPEADRVAEVMAILRDIAGGEIPEPVEVATTDWLGSKFTQGCYSNVGDTGQAATWIPALAEPVGRVLFAGEATSLYWFGHVEGGWDSGIREAKRLLQAPAVPIL